MSLLCVSLSCYGWETGYRVHKIDTPFPMPDIRERLSQNQRFPITDYGADTTKMNTASIAGAIDASNRNIGGGRVIIPAGRWKTGPIHLKSNVSLHLEEGGVLVFSDNPEDYLPAVRTSWEGMECYNYSPLIYAYDCRISQ